jgi:hypothetical protein
MAMGFVCRRDMFSLYISSPQDKFKDDKDDCRNKEFAARNNKPIIEDKFKDEKDDCRNKATARKDKPTARMSSKMTTMTVATKIHRKR